MGFNSAFKGLITLQFQLLSLFITFKSSSHNYINCAFVKRLTTPSDFHIPLPSIVLFTHSQISFIHGCIYSIFPGSPRTSSFFPSFRFPVNNNFWQSRQVHSLGTKLISPLKQQLQYLFSVRLYRIHRIKFLKHFKTFISSFISL